VPLRAVIVDDERLARRMLRSLLEAEPEIEVVGEAGRAQEAVRVIRQQRPDLLFLDIQMPGMDGFELLNQAGLENLGQVIFVTAHDRFAARAFEVDAIDYILKPFDRTRLRQAIARARGRRGEDVSGRLLGLLERLGGPGKLQRLVVRDGEVIRFLEVEEVTFLESADNYVTVRSGAAQHLIRTTLQRLEATLDPARFVRIHRRFIVNLSELRECRHGANGYEAHLRDGTVLPVGRQYRDRLLVSELGA